MITIDNGTEIKRFSDFNMLVASGHNAPILPDYSHQSISIPKQSGAIKTGEKVATIAFSLPLVIHDSDWSSRQESYNKLKSFLFNDLKESIPLKVIFDFEADKYYKLHCNGISMPDKKMHHDKIEISFIGYDSNKYSIVQNDEIVWGSEVITFESHAYTLGHENASAEFVILNNRTINVDVIGLALQPIIVITGSATDLVIENNDKYIEVGTFFNAMWKIDTEKYIAYLNGKEKILKMNKFMLLKGMNQILFSGTNMDLKVTIRFRDRWL